MNKHNLSPQHFSNLISKITPENKTETSILNELQELASINGINALLSTITSEFHDDPESFDFTEDEFEIFCFKHELTDIPNTFDYYFNGITKAITENEDPTFLIPAEPKIIDLTETTDDPGNTELFLAYIPFESDEMPNAKQCDHLLTMLYKQFTSSGDHHEEITILLQNNELILIFNNNK